MTSLIDRPCLIQIPAAAYHADPSHVPSLSSGIAKLLVNRRPIHAWYKHPRLNPFFDPRDDDELKVSTAFGSCCHERFLGEGGDIHVMGNDKDGNPITEFRTKAAKQERDEALAQGKIVVKRDEYERAERVVDEAQRQLFSWFDFDGDSEVTGIAHHGKGVVTRFMIDRLLKNGTSIVDLKFTEVAASAEEWPQQAARMGYHIQGGHYRSGLASVLGVDVRHTDFLFVIVEIGPPVQVIVHELPMEMAEIGLEQAERAREIWGNCLSKGTDIKHWPGYERKVHCGDAPGWLLARYETQKIIEKLDMGA